VRDGENGPLSLVKSLLVCTYPLFRHAILIRVGNIQRRRGNIAVTGEPLYLRGVSQREGPEQKALCF